MDIWLSFNNGAEKLRLPVLPATVGIQQGNNNTTVNITDLGELNLIGKSKLSAMSISTFFPKNYYPNFCQYSTFPDPFECVKMINNWRKSGKPIRVVVTETDINMACSVENFNHQIQDATKDVYYTLDLKEYIFAAVENVINGQSTNTKQRENTQTTPATYTVKSGDSLWTISKKIYGDGSKYATLATKNGIKSPYNVNAGQVLYT